MGILNQFREMMAMKRIRRNAASVELKEGESLYLANSRPLCRQDGNYGMFYVVKDGALIDALFVSDKRARNG